MLATLLDDGWNYHDSESERLARELESAADAPIPAASLAPFLHLATHTIGGHLGDWPRACALGRRVLAGHLPEADTARAWQRLYVATVLAGDAIAAIDVELSCLEASAAPLATALVMRLELSDALADVGRADEAGRIYRSALEVAARVEISPELDRATAIVSNNLAWTLHDLSSHTAEQGAVMALAADASLLAWRRCGNWINEELALYLKASVAYSAGDIEAALKAAATGLAVIRDNGRRPLDAARFHLLRARSFAARGDTVAQADALADADREAAAIASGDLQQQFALERAIASGQAGRDQRTV